MSGIRPCLLPCHSFQSPARIFSPHLIASVFFCSLVNICRFLYILRRFHATILHFLPALSAFLLATICPCHFPSLPRHYFMLFLGTVADAYSSFSGRMNYFLNDDTIPEVKGPTNFICYWRIFVIANIGN